MTHHRFLRPVLLTAVLLAACTPPETDTSSAAECVGLTSPIEVGGAVDTDTTWACTAVPYLITTDVMVGGGATLTVGPGVTLEMSSQTSIVVGNDSQGGGLIADGTDAPILITSAEAVPSPGDWEAIVLDGNTLVGVLVDVTLEYGGDFTPDGSTGGNGVIVVMGEADITGTTVTDSASYGIDFLTDGRASAFGENSFARNASESIRIWAPHLATIDSDNTFEAGDRVRVDGGVVDESGTWGAIGAPYRFAADVAIEGSGNPQITIEPGTELRFDGEVSLIVGQGSAGGIIADATDLEPIVFTSSEAVPGPGDWEGIVADGNATTATFRNVTVAFAGDFSPDASAGGSAALRAIDAQMTVENCVFESNASVAVWFDGTASAGAFSGNTFVANDVPLSLLPGAVGSLTGPNTFDPADRVEIRGGTVASSMQWSELGAPYRILDDVLVQGSDDPVLTVEPGVELQMSDQVALVVGRDDGGSIIADGTPSRILITSDEPVPGPGDWEAVVFDGNTLPGATLRNVDLSFCGDFTPTPSTGIRGCIGVIDSSPTIEDCTIDSSAANGIDLSGTATPTLNGNVFTNIADDDVN